MSSDGHTPIPNRANYHDANVMYHVPSQLGDSSFILSFAEDWRSGWTRSGKLNGDHLPVIRVSMPNGGFALIRPYYCQNTSTAAFLLSENGTGDRIVAFKSPFIDSSDVFMGGQVVKLVPVYVTPFGPTT